MERGRDASERGPEGRSDEYTLVGIVEDGTPLNRVVKEIRELGVGKDDLTVVVKRPDTDESEPFPEGTRYIVVPDDKRGLEVPVGFAISFILLGLFFALVVPSIGVPTFLVFISLAAILIAGSFTRVGVQPILTDMGAPREDSGEWNDQFELGKVLVFAVTRERRLIRPIREAIQGSGGAYFIVDRRLEPRAVAQASIHRAGPGERQSVVGPREA